MPDVIPISAVTDPAWGRSMTSQAPPGELGKDAFMKLLVAQLKYQNPMSPTDPSQFMAQTAEFTMVEKLTELADESAVQRAYTASLTATSLLGRTVTWLGADGTEKSGVVTGSTFGSQGATLSVGDQRIPLDYIRSVTTSQEA